MISHLVYVNCDECGTPAEAVLGRAREARRAAHAEGFRRRGNLDLCEGCWRKEHGEVWDGLRGEWVKERA